MFLVFVVDVFVVVFVAVFFVVVFVVVILVVLFPSCRHRTVRHGPVTALAVIVRNRTFRHRP